MPALTTAAGGFSEREFYLRQFRGRTMQLVAAEAAPAERAAIAAVLDELARAHVRVVVASASRALLEALHAAPLSTGESGAGFEGRVWRALRTHGRCGLLLQQAQTPAAAAAASRAAAAKLGVFKLVLLDSAGGMCNAAGARTAFADAAALQAAASTQSARAPLWREVLALLRAGVPAVNVCAAQGLAAELFSYAGAGTMFTRARYVEVRRLALDDFDAAANLLARGEAEGYLAPRNAAAADSVLAAGFGAFVEARHLAGIGALLPFHANESACELAALYTLTRFQGEGVGPHLLRFAAAQARARGFKTMFACTTHARVSGFFARNGFAPCAADALPAAKWRGYAAARRAQLHCHRRALE